MLSVSGLKKAFGGRDLFSEVTFALTPGQRVGLVGPNGCGKTTLLKILAGQVAPDGGSVALSPECELGYLGQEGQLSPDRTLYAEMLEIFSATLALEQRLRELEHEMATLEGAELEALLKRYDRLQNEYETAEPHLIDARIRTVLAGVGFSERDFERPCREFSGGWQMKGAMARLLLGSPDVLLMDEPTNHLDLYAVEWLEEYLASYKGTVLMVSHDRAFLDRVVNRVLSFEFGQVEDYAGNYTFFLQEREERHDRQLAAYQAQQKQLAHDQRFIERFRAKATLASRVKSREKRLEKLERIEAPTGPAKKMKAGFSSGLTSGQELYKVIDLAKSYAGVEVFRDVNFELVREDRLALVGRNGAGKSTLMRLLAGLEEPDAGRIKAGYRVEPVYFAQHQAEALSPHHTVLESLDEVAPPGTTQTRLRTLLGCLLFEADDVFKPISVLSGGERSRVALARCIIRPSNLLLLDEPTNHLDLDARESLLDALEDYPGTIVLITHDRHFMDGLVTRVLELAGGRARVFLGNYSRYRDKVEQERRQAEAARAAAAKEAKKKPIKKSASPPPRGRQVEWKLEALETKIFGLEEELESLAAQLGDPALYQDGAAHESVQSRYAEVEAQIAELTAIWDTMT